MTNPAKKRSTPSAAPVAARKKARQVAGEGSRKTPDPGSKQSRIIAMLQSPSGATLAAMMKATAWQPHSVRGFLAAVVRKRLKLKLSSTKMDGHRVYRIAGESSGKAKSRASRRQSS